MKKIGVACVIALLAFTVAGCADDSNTPAEGHWIATDRGDVYCIQSDLAYGAIATDCNWDSRVSLGTHTTNADEIVEGQWRKVEDGEVYCLIHPASHGTKTTDCDWSSLRG